MTTDEEQQATADATAQASATARASSDAAMNEIMASIRRAVSSNEPIRDEPWQSPERAAEPEAAPTPVQPNTAVPAPTPPVPATTDSITLEALARSLLEPMLKSWLDANLPEMVERAVEAEIVRLTARGN